MTKYTEESTSTYESDNDQSETEETEHDLALTTRYKNSDIRNIIIETIDDKYSKAMFGPFEVIMMSENGYVNATKLCKGAGKEFREWRRSKSAKEYMKYIIEPTGFSTGSMIITITGGKRDMRGAYVHPDLIINIAQWCSPEYSYKVTKVMHEYHSKQAIEEKDLIIGKKDDKIDKLSKQIDLMREEQKREMSKLLAHARKQGVQLDRMEDTLETIAEDRVVKGKPRNKEFLVIVKRNGDPEEHDDYYEYRAIRIGKRNKTSTINKLRSDWPDLEILLDLEQPNSVNLWQRFVDNFSKKIQCKGCDFDLRRPFNQKRMIRAIKTLHDERFDY